MAGLPIGLQLYSVRDECGQDMSGVLAAVSRMGYQGVEFAGYHGRTASELRRLLDDNGLRCCGTHTRLESIAPNQIGETIAFNSILGNRFLIVPSVPAERRATASAWREIAEMFNAAAETARPHGMVVGYHNHSFEFQPLDGELPWDIFFGSTSQEVVMQLDTGNALKGGADPVPFLQRYPGRALTVHLKEYSAINETALIGEGDIRWDEVFALCEGYGGTEWYIVEQESYAHPPLECVDLCLQRLKAMGK